MPYINFLYLSSRCVAVQAPTTKADLERLIENQVQEGIHLEYKESRALIGNAAIAEITKDISAFANSDGGLLVYGVREHDHIPTSIDDGVADSEMPKERLEQIITSNVAPRIDGLLIHRIPLSGTHSAYAIDIPKSYRAPHQDRASKRYYKRFNFTSQPMEDYEVADVRTRSRTITPLVVFDVEIQHKTLFLFLISNPGDVAAHDVRFRFSEKLTWDKEEPALIKNGIKVLPVRREYRLLYGVTYEVFDPEKNRCTRFVVEATYFHPVLQREITETTTVDLQDYLGTWPAQDPLEDLGERLKNSLTEVRNELRSLVNGVQSLNRIAGDTGLQISTHSLRSIAQSFEHEPKIARLEPYGRSPAFFSELLGVDRGLARRISSHFRAPSPPPLEEVAGLSAELISSMREVLRIDS